MDDVPTEEGETHRYVKRASKSVTRHVAEVSQEALDALFFGPALRAREASEAARGNDGELSDNELQLELAKLQAKNEEAESRRRGALNLARYSLLGLALWAGYQLFWHDKLEGLEATTPDGTTVKVGAALEEAAAEDAAEE